MGNQSAPGALQVVHNDIKSKNILLTKDATVAKVADVGTSRILESTACTLSVPMLYTWPYAAPEQISGNRHACSIKVSPVQAGGGGGLEKGLGFCGLLRATVCLARKGVEWGGNGRGGQGAEEAGSEHP